MCRTAAALALTALMLIVPSCSNVIDGVAQPDPRKPGVALSEDGFGIVAGFADAPVQLELFTEPQCEHCADFQATFGEDIKAAIVSGQVVLTYRPVTFLDHEYDIDYSAMAANALFLAVAPETSATTFQGFVEDLWANQDLSWEEYGTGDFADLAKGSGLSPAIVEKIDSGDTGVDTDEMNSTNLDSLGSVSGGRVGTPTVYDLTSKDIVDIADSDWLNKLLTSI
jgi:protein-disulfide isomerase